MSVQSVVVLRFGDRRLPRGLAGTDVVDVTGDGDVDAAAAEAGRLLVVGTDADLAAVLTRLMRAERLGVELAHVRGWRGAHRARSAPARRTPLIRDDAGKAIVGAALWLPNGPHERGAPPVTLIGEAVVDDQLLFDGEVAGVRIEPTPSMPGLRASVLSGHMRPRRWLTGRAAQLGTPEALVVRDGVAATRPVKRSTFYRHTEGWLRVG